MYIFWNNINKFPQFIISVFMGFFLTTIYQIFKLLSNKKTRVIIVLFLVVFFISFYWILKLMLGDTLI
uniref:Uncharacterized protein ycf33 n=1 Tax=Balbiania investiens TaxID=111861 RepID=A0A4D6BLG1_9FLOR|nr:hypothetical protein [Balbiania investiens]QBX88585.1 hypothetical protein [Balbiania investiens]